MTFIHFFRQTIRQHSFWWFRWFRIYFFQSFYFFLSFFFIFIRESQQIAFNENFPSFYHIADFAIFNLFYTFSVFSDGLLQFPNFFGIRFLLSFLVLLFFFNCFSYIRQNPLFPLFTVSYVRLHLLYFLGSIRRLVL